MTQWREKESISCEQDFGGGWVGLSKQIVGRRKKFLCKIGAAGGIWKSVPKSDADGKSSNLAK